MESQPGERVETWTKSLQPPYVRVKLLEAGAPLTGGPQRRVKAVEELGSLTVLCVAGGEPVPEVSLAVNGIILHTERVLLHTLHPHPQCDHGHGDCLLSPALRTMGQTDQ